jgi:hypothetical protein
MGTVPDNPTSQLNGFDHFDFEFVVVSGVVPAIVSLSSLLPRLLSSK